MENNVFLGATAQSSFLVQPAGTFPTTTTKPASTTTFDWGKVFNSIAEFGTNYFTSRSGTNQPTGGGTTIINQPAPMSQTTKALLIGGGILVAGLLVFTLTKKK